MNVPQRCLLSIPGLVLFAIAAPVQAQVADPTAFAVTCKAAIFDVERDIEAYRRVYVNDIRAFDISERYADAPADRPLNLYIGLDAYDAEAEGDYVTSSAQDILASSQLLTAYTRQILDNCDAVGSITFAITDYQLRQFGLFEDGEVMEFSCAAPHSSVGQQLPWGFRFCL